MQREVKEQLREWERRRRIRIHAYYTGAQSSSTRPKRASNSPQSGDDGGSEEEIEKEFLKNCKASSTLTGLRLDGDSGNPIFKPQDIWNAHQELKTKQLGSLTPTQAIMKHLDDAERWYMDHKKKSYSDELE